MANFLFFGLAAVIALVSGAGTAMAQNTSSVSSPGVTADRKEIAYRFGWVPGEDGAGSSFAHRFDYGFSLDARTSLKLNARFEDQPGGKTRFDNLNAEYLIELTPETARVWQSGIRFDGRLSNGPDPERIGVNWLNRWRFGNGMQARAMLVATRAFGGDADGTIAFEGRTSLSARIAGDHEIAMLGFFDLGTSRTVDIGDQDSQLGPAISGPLGQGWRWTAGNLFGLSGDTPDNDVRLWVSRHF